MIRLPALALALSGLVLVACGDTREVPATGGVVSGVVRKGGEPGPARVRLFLLEAGGEYERAWEPNAELYLGGTLATGEPMAVQDVGADGRYLFQAVAAGRYQVHAVDGDGWQAVRMLDLPVSGVREAADLTLVGGEHVIRGRAVYADGRPFEGRVWAVPPQQRRGRRALREGVWPVEASLDGTFEVRALEARGYVLCLHKPDVLYAEQHPMQVPHAEELQIVVDEGAVEIAGRIVSSPAGEPVVGAAVSIRGRGRQGLMIVRTRTDAEGRFAVLGPPVERLIRVQADGYVPIAAKHASDSDFVAHLLPFAVVRGRAVDLATGRPVAGARVHMCPLDTSGRYARRRSAITGEDGSFSLNRATPGEAMLYVTGRRWISAALLGPQDESQCPCALTLGPGEVRETVVPVVLASRAIGRVLDAQGRPVPGVVVRANRVGRAAGSSVFPPYRAVTATDEHGRFVCDDLVGGVPHRLVARPSGRAGTQSDVVYPSASLDVELRLPPPRWLEVRVVERDTKAPVADARVTVTRAVGSWRTDADGRARVGPLGAGKVSVWVDHAEYVERDARSLVPGSEKDGDPPLLVVTLDRGHTIRGRSSLPDGQPQPNGTIRVEHRGRLLAASIPSSDGAFVFSRLPAKTLDVIAQCTVEGRSLVGDARGEAGGGEVLVSLRDAGAARVPDLKRAVLHVRVVDEEGRPAVGGDVRLHGVRASVPRRLSRGEADLLRLTGGAEAWIEVSGARSVAGIALAATLFGPVAPSVPAVEITLAAGGKVTGRVLDEDEVPVAGIHLFARGRFVQEVAGRPVEGRHATALTGADGSFVLEGLGEAEYVLAGALPRRLRLPEDVLVEAGDRDVLVVVEEALAGTLTVVDDRGRPLAGAVVQLRTMPRELPGGRISGFGGRVPPPQTDEAGEHPFGPLDDLFDYSLRVEPPEDRPDLAIFEQKPWEPESHVVHLQRGLPLRGHLRLLGGRRIDELKVTCKPAGQRSRAVEPGSGGSFAFESLPPGPASLGIRLDRVGMDTWSRRMEVQAGETDVVYEVDLGEPLRVEIENWPRGQREYMRFAVLLPESHLPENPSLRPHARLGRTMRFEGLDADETYTLRVVGMDDGTCYVGRGIVPGPGVRRIRLEPGRTIRGLLLLPPGHQKPRVSASSDVDGASGKVDERGAFEIRGLPEGAWRVKAFAEGPDDRWSEGEVRVEAGDEVDLVLEEHDG